MTTPAAAQSAVDRFGCSLAFVRLHWLEHRCLDSKVYTGPCLIVDPAREAEALALMTGRPWPAVVDGSVPR